MRHNPARRAALLDGAIEVLAREGARGLTFRSVDTEAQVPHGTASNYFANRDDLLIQVGHRCYERLEPEQDVVAAALEGPRDRGRVTELMRDIVERLSEFRSGYLALLELRLEATRRPELRRLLTERIRADVEANIDFHDRAGLPGDATTVVVLYLALNWLVLERLTLPGVFPERPGEDLIAAVVERLLPDPARESDV
ncbi:TetR/AcrR family transcriptional regulator [Prauserella muralis]|uniref:TetR family transcriptional regulator n=1 Tax=Prauserella muralis TaxID=588067 RepID=A0A2V4AP04_9PSEU|nr:TetR/AcrR family transcriptional regulator [Prauserella muralis]PXY22433.1 TetR family transcriptional regulator [Prauserella muralis]TWE28104.1 TetR family transcriptional regulator [Prauserella muralis]